MDTPAYHWNFEWQDEVRIVLLGRSGVGKSETGTGILGACNRGFEFRPSFCPVTEKCQMEFTYRYDTTLHVTDTPGIITSKEDKNNDSNIKEIIKCLDMNAPGPNVFLYILRADVRFDSEDVDALKAMAGVFGEEVFRYMIIVFTRGKQLKSSDRSVDDKLKEMPKEFQELYQKCHGRYVTIENPGPEQNGMEYIAKDRQRQRDISNLVETIYQLLCDNNWTYYSNRKGIGMKKEE